jgi:excinuclease ABC subunit B
MYADRVTASMAAAIRETDRRRERQAAYNAEHGITPESVQRSIHEVLQSIYERDYYTVQVQETPETVLSADELAKRIDELENQMKDAARRLDFEQAADLRDRVRALRRRHL